MSRFPLRCVIVPSILCSLMIACASVSLRPLKQNERIIFLGDSITAAGFMPGGYAMLVSKAINKAFPDLEVEIVNAGVSADRVPDCQARLDPDVLKKAPTIVVIYIGTNDVWQWMKNRGTTKEYFEHGLHDIIRRINSVGARVILCSPTVIGEKTDGTNLFDKMLDEYSEISRKVAIETGSQFLDLHNAFLSYLKKHNTANLPEGVLTSDGVHLNERGNRLVAALILDALNVPQVDAARDQYLFSLELLSVNRSNKRLPPL